MAKRKHKSIAAAAVAAPTRRPRKGPRPSVEIVEISSGEEDGEEQERFGGVLRGLNPQNVLAPTEPATEGLASTQTVRHGTRQSYHGKTEANYNMKYHPMDDVTRPKRAARHRPSTVHDDQAETDEETLPSSARHSDASTDSEEDESSGEDSGEVIRAPDPKATRHSTRPSKAKTVNYSAKHHPQDYGLPGFQHKAKLQKKALKRATKISKSSKSPLNAIDLTKEEATGTESLGEAAREGDATDGAKAMPRKKLRSLEDDRETGNAKKSKKSTRTTHEVKNNSMPLSDSIADTDTTLIEVAKKGRKESETLFEQFEGISSSHANESERYSDDGGFMPRINAPENDKSPSDLEEHIAITEKAASQDPHPNMAFDAPPNGIPRSSSTPATQRSDLSPDNSTRTSLTSNDGSHQELHKHLTNKDEENNLVGAGSGSFAESFSGISAADTHEEILNHTQ